MANDALADARAEIEALLEVIENGAEGASREWLEAAHEALRRAEARFRQLERDTGHRGAPVGWSHVMDQRAARSNRPN